MTTQDQSATTPTSSLESAADLNTLLDHARSLIAPGQRRILGITGAPGAGKTTLAELLTDSLGEQSVLVSMDGFHLSNAQLHRLNRHARKGSADTFDVAGYINLLRRLRNQVDPIVYAPYFDRAIDESIGSAVPVPADTPLVITEGNYLLVNDPEWSPIADLLDACWFVEPGEQLRMDRLVARHIAYGRTKQEAYERSCGSDQENAALVAGTRHLADRVVQVPTIHWPEPGSDGVSPP